MNAHLPAGRHALTPRHPGDRRHGPAHGAAEPQRRAQARLRTLRCHDVRCAEADQEIRELLRR